MEDLESSQEDLNRVVLGKRRNNRYSVSASSNDSENLLFHERVTIRNVVCEVPPVSKESLNVQRKLFSESENVSKEKTCLKRRGLSNRRKKKHVYSEANKENVGQNVYDERKEDQVIKKPKLSRGSKPVKPSGMRSVS